MSTCFGCRRKSRDEDTEALLPAYDDDTTRQRSLHAKLHTYQMLRALSIGYMPSTEQVIINLRTLLASNFLQDNNPGLSDSGLLLVKYARRWLQQFIELLRSKNGEDQIQDIIWGTTKSRMRVDTTQISAKTSLARKKADASAAYQSVLTIGNLLMTNSSFRLFLNDLGIILRDVFSDTAFSISSVAEEAGKGLKPPDEERTKMKHAESGPPPTTEEIEASAKDLSNFVGNGLAKTGQDTLSSAKEHVSGQEKDVLLQRLKDAVLKLRQKPDYSDSVSTISLIIKNYALAYSKALDQSVEAARESVNVNLEFRQAVESLWALISSFGDKTQWQKLERNLRKLAQHSHSDPDFENLVRQLAEFLQELLLDPGFYDKPEKKIAELQDRISDTQSNSDLRGDLMAVIEQGEVVLKSVWNDEAISNVIATSAKLIQLLSPADQIANGDLLRDLLHVFIPGLIQAIQYIPIPRLEVSVPEADLLLENLVLEPGATVNESSFLPYKLLVQTQNELEISKGHSHRTRASTTNLATLAIKGLSLRAEELGFWLRAHKGIFKLADEGIASFELDERGIDIALDIEIGRERLEKILSLRKVRVKVHKLNYTLRKSKFAWLAWLVKPIVRPIMRSVMEKQIATAIADALHFANRELLFARERLRATRISDPQDLRTFFKAVATRLTPADDPDLYTYLGVRPSQGRFKGVYAPGSLVQLWEEEARLAKDKIQDSEVDRQGGWRNEIFDVATLTA